MNTAKVSLTLDKELVAEAREVAGRRALSSYLNRALRNQLQHDRIADLLAELERDKGPIEARVMAEVRDEWPGREGGASRRRSA